MTDLTLHQPSGTDLATQMEFARAVAASGVLPRAYRDNPGSVLIAVNLGAAMGLAPAESLYRIHVIEGKPSASAELIAANVRKAGHRLRVRGDDQHAVVQIIRSDDPDWPFEVEWTIERAKAAGLTGKDVWKKYPASMLKARAITECARTACPEALYGVTYVTEELDDRREGHATVEAPSSSRQALRAAISQAAAPAPAVVVEPEPAATAVVEPSPEAEPGPLMVTPAQLRKIGAAMTAAGITDRALALAFVSEAVGRPVTSRNDLTKTEAVRLIDALEDEVAAAFVYSAAASTVYGDTTEGTDG